MNRFLLRLLACSDGKLSHNAIPRVPLGFSRRPIGAIRIAHLWLVLLVWDVTWQHCCTFSAKGGFHLCLGMTDVSTCRALKFHLHHHHHRRYHYHLITTIIIVVVVARCVPTGSSSRGGGVAVYVFDINQPSLPTPFYSTLVSVSVFTALSTVFRSTNSPENSPLSHSVLSVFFCLIGPFNYVSLYESLPQPWCNPVWLTGLKAPT